MITLTERGSIKDKRRNQSTERTFSFLGFFVLRSFESAERHPGLHAHLGSRWIFLELWCNAMHQVEVVVTHSRLHTHWSHDEIFWYILQSWTLMSHGCGGCKISHVFCDTLLLCVYRMRVCLAAHVIHTCVATVSSRACSVPCPQRENSSVDIIVVAAAPPLLDTLQRDNRTADIACCAGLLDGSVW